MNKVFEHILEVRWSDMDALGHVNNAKYVTYFEMCRTNWFSSLDSDVSGEKSGVSVVVAHLSIDFKRSVVFPAKLKVELYVDEPGRSSLQTYSKLVDVADPEIVYAESKTVIVWVDVKSSKSTSIPESIVAKLPC
jgi:acyl-CoA thioester hydrolase